MCPRCNGGNRVMVFSDGGDVSPCCVASQEYLRGRITDGEDLAEFRQAGDEARAAFALRERQLKPMPEPAAA